MANSYFDSADWTSLVANTLARASGVNSPLLAVEVGFDRVEADIALIEGALATSLTSLSPGTGAKNFTLQDARTLNAGGYWARRAADPLTFMVVELAAAISASTTFNTTARAYNDNTSTGPYTDWVIYGLGGTRNIATLGISTDTTVSAGHLASIIELTGASGVTVTMGTIASLGLGFWVILRNASTAAITLARSSTNTFSTTQASGSTSYTIAAGEEVLVSAGSTSVWKITRFAALTAANVQAGSVWDAGTFGGTANALTCTLSPAPAALSRGTRIVGLAAATNTASATITANSLALTIKKRLAGGKVALTGGEIISGELIELVSDGTDAILQEKPEWQAGAALTSAATIDLSTTTGEYCLVNGSTGPVTSLGTLPAGVLRVLRFASTPTLTHNAASLILPGAANIIAAAGDIGWFISEGSGNWRCVAYLRAGFPPGVIPYTIKTSNYTAVAGDKIIMDCSSAAKTVTMPASPSNTDAPITIKKHGANLLTVDFGAKSVRLPDGTTASGTHTIDGTQNSDFDFAYIGTDAAGTTNLWVF